MSQLATLSTIIDARVKEAATQFCKRRGLKLRHLVEQALVEQLEDEIDLEAYHQRRNEETIPLEKILAGRKKSK
jgi:antitoxin component of RelBE/YafQ-DinJ toxin-antitoxin module